MDDAGIIKLYFDRDERAIEESNVKYGAYCKRVAYNILTDLDDSEQCVTDTWVRAWSTVPPTLPKILKAFFAKITRNLAIDRYRSRQAKSKIGDEYLLSLDELSECVSGNEVDVNSAEIGRIIGEFLLSETAINRRMFILRYFYTESLEKTAKNCSCSVAMTKSALFRMRERLKQRLIKEGVEI